MLINVLLWILFGALAGWIASIVIGVNYKQSAYSNVMIGVLGALLGGFFIKYLGGSSVQTLNISSLIIAIVGSVGLLALVSGFNSIEE